MNNKILITGATGSTGTDAVRKLLELNIPVRALVHRIDKRSGELARLGPKSWRAISWISILSAPLCRV